MVNCKNGIPTCPVACKYCMAQKIDIRANHWKEQKRIGMNKSCVFFNRLPQDPKIEEMNFPWELLDGEFIGFQGITDCFWDIFTDDLKFIVDKVKNSNIKKLCLISKIPVNNDQLEILKQIKNKLTVCYSITGLDELEKTSTDDRIEALVKMKNEGIDVLPVIHPYIHGYCKIEKIIKILSKEGFNEINWKGFRYNPENMKELENYISKEILNNYIGENVEEEILVGNEYANSVCNKYNMKYVDLKEYLHREKDSQFINMSEKEYADMITKEVYDLAKLCVFSTSSSKEAVIRNCIERRLKNNSYGC